MPRPSERHSGLLPDDKIEYRRLLLALKQRYGSVEGLSRALDVTSKTARRWLECDSEAELSKTFELGSADKLLAAAATANIRIEQFATGAQLYDCSKSYADNMNWVPGTSYTPQRLECIPTRFLGYELESPFGVSSGVLTADPYRTGYLLRRANSVVTTKSFRSRMLPPRDPPNIGYCRPLGQLNYSNIAAQEPRVEILHNQSRYTDGTGLIVRFDCPSEEPEVWQSYVEQMLRYCNSRQLLIGSVQPTDWAGTGRVEDLRADLHLLLSLMREAGVRAIEINLACPNTGTWVGRLYQQPEQLIALLSEAKSIVPEIPLLLKLGPLNEPLASSIVDATASYVDGYTAINAVRCHARMQMGFYEDAVGALAGPPLLQLGLESVAALRTALDKRSLPHGLIGVGGVWQPVDVCSYQKRGADIVQAASVFLEDTLFGYKVLCYLAGIKDSKNAQIDSMADFIKVSRENFLNALWKVSDELKDDGRDMSWEDLHRVTMPIHTEYERRMREKADQHAWRVQPHTAGEWKKEILSRLHLKGGRFGVN